ncbi:Endonuclease, Uma2 family (restriction endonuclease fold) [Paractinoplanes atraurantiacus]|uniref:Endonuclease, Uma2 family (Restriction endonuclease fold) n=2 Tax=Paractinoplanes atraurantiacus TaxID=1036182 RepID=A0A285FSW5_9ACTN|nr:Endonuclease, Uma2 family (restriction endonuclease fold) [Actinoplanes atraurantiacus]
MTAALRLPDPSLLQRRDLTVDDIADLPEDLRYELIEGRLVLSPRAKTTHQLLSKKIGDAIEVNCPDEFMINIEQAVLIGPGTELHPDVVLLREESGDCSPVLPEDVLLAVEVVSASSKSTDRGFKLKQYAAVEIPSYWIVDPLAERVTFTQFVLSAPGVYDQVVETSALVTVHQPWEITLDLPAWTRRRDRIRSNNRPRR